MVHEVTKMIQGEPKSSPQAQRNGVMGFLRNGSKASDGQHETASGSADVELELICRLPPAKCFRAELSRTLTCQRCGYSRKQAETFYDFSLDLPYYPVSELEPVAEQEPTAKREPQASPSLGRRCFCNLVPHVTGVDDDRYYCCTNSSCSYREKVVDSGGCRTSPAKLTDTGVSASSSLSPISGWPSRPAPIELETLLQKQFETEVLELTCEKCKDGKEAQSAYEVKSLPSILVLHLKRFEVDPQTGVLFKRCDLVVPPPVIDPVRSIDNSSSSGSERHYMLKSVIHHLGKNIDEGHYVADVCDAHGQWIRRNDTHESKTMRYNRTGARNRVTCSFT
uniref:USP domain-containing protein n=1 Tax=Hyaloperonospora arabidopsidis (strain Emoy2) TaxID=559515 RepID=M4C6M3_HYAAE